MIMECLVELKRLEKMGRQFSKARRFVIVVQSSVKALLDDLELFFISCFFCFCYFF